MRYYKVFKRDGGKLTSSWASGAANVEYEVGKLSTPPKWLEDAGYGITVFASLREAAEYVITLTGSSRPSSRFPIYSVSILGCAKTPACMANNSYLKLGQLRLSIWHWPSGTLMVSGVVPMAEISHEELKNELGGFVG